MSKQVELTCMVFGGKFMGDEPQMCCIDPHCYCMGMPIDPIVCSEECYLRLIKPQEKGGNEE